MIGSSRNQEFMHKAISYAGGATLIAMLLFGTGVMYAADSAALVSQTIADNTQEAPGAGYTQVWTTRNSGTTTWDSSYSLQYVSGNAGWRVSKMIGSSRNQEFMHKAIIFDT